MQTQFFRRPEGTLAYTDYGGSGDLVLMLPGMGALRSEYRYLAPKLKEAGYRAVAVDLRGHGESSVPWQTYDVPSTGNDILGLVEHLNGATAPAHLIGTSFAAASCVWAAVECPDCFRSAVLIGPFVRTPKMNPIMTALYGVMMNNPWRVRTWSMYYGTLYPTQKPADFKDYIGQLRANLSQPGRFDAAAALGNSSREPSASRLGQIKVPVLVIMGTKDPDFSDPAAEAMFIAEQTGGSFDLIEGAGHYPQTEMPEITAPIVIDFLQRSKS